MCAAVLGCVVGLAGSATAAGEEIVVETAQLNPANPTQWIDYSVATTQAAWLVNSVTCLKLLDYDDLTGQLVPEAAQAMPTVSPDGLTWTFTVRPGQAFSGGPAEPVSAESFKRAIERATSSAMASSIAPSLPPARNVVAGIQGSAAFFAGTGPFSGVQASGNTLTIQLSAPDATFAYRIAMPYFCATRADAPATYTGAAPHSGGPYFVSSASSSGTQPNLQHEIVLLRNTAYSGSRIRNLGTIRVAQHGSPLREDYVHAAPSAYAASPPPGVSVTQNITTGIQVLALNTSKAPFSSEAMRQAVAHAIDRTALSSVPGAGWQPTDQFVSPLLPGHADADVYSLSADTARATDLLDGAQPTVRLCHPSGVRALVAQVIQHQLQQVGIQVITVQPGNFFPFIANPANCDLALLQWLPQYADGTSVLNLLFRSPTNFSFFDDPAFNARFDAALAITPEPARHAEVAAMDRDLAASAVAIAIGHDRRHDGFAGRVGCRIFSQVHFGYALNRLCIEVSASADPGGDPVSTGGDATSAAPLQTSVAVPAGGTGGTVTITQGVSDASETPSFGLLEQQLDITAPAQTPESPLVLTFEIDAQTLADASLSVDDVVVLRNGTAIADCSDPVGTSADPDPCVASRTTDGDGDGVIVVRTSQASTWNFAGGRVSGPFQPVDAQPTVNVMKAGRAVPVKFSLGGDFGLDVLESGWPKSEGGPCTGGSPDEIETTSSDDGLTYDSASGRYTYHWKTAKSWKGHCRTLTVRLRDGQELRTSFRFT